MFVCYVTGNINCVLRKISGSKREQNVKFINKIVEETFTSVYEINRFDKRKMSVIFNILVFLSAQLYLQ